MLYFIRNYILLELLVICIRSANMLRFDDDLRLVRTFAYEIRGCGRFWSGDWTAAFWG